MISRFDWPVTWSWMYETELPAVMSNLPSFWPLVASALLTMESIVTFRPSAANSPWS